LGDLHSIQPDFPTQTPRTEGGRLPIVFNEPDVVFQGIDAKRFKAVEIDILNVERRRFDDDLILVIVLKPIGVLAVSTILRTARRFDIGYPPGLRP
jgi:hypothetical protein